MQYTDEHYDKAVKYILEHTSHRPKKAIILGSGLGEYAENLKDADIINYEDIPNFPRSTVEGHKGRFVINDDIICMQGRDIPDEGAQPFRGQDSDSDKCRRRYK